MNQILLNISIFLKVCLPLKEDNEAATCVIDPNLYISTRPPSTTSTLPPVQSSTPTQPQTTSTLPPHTTPPSRPSTVTSQRKHCLFEGYFRDPNDPSCRKFYRCYSVGKHYRKVDEGVCPPGTVFDETLSSCQYDYMSNESCLTANQ